MSDFLTIKNDAIGEEYYKLTHKSGCEIVVYPKNFSSSYAVIASKYGSIHSAIEMDGKVVDLPDGIAHFLEHKMFENADGEDTFVKFGSLGASANAYTTYDKTAYMYSTTGDFYAAFEVLLKSMYAPNFTEENVAKERGIIEQEIVMYEDDPGDALYLALMDAMYHVNPVKKSIVGTAKTIAEITPQLLYECFGAFYHPSSMVLVVCGQVDVDSVLAVADKYLPILPQVEMAVPTFDEPKAVRLPQVKIQRQVSKPKMAIGIKDVAISTNSRERMKKCLTQSLMCMMLFSTSSEFASKLYEDGLISAPLSYWQVHYPTFSFIHLYAESDCYEEIYGRFIAFINSVKRDGVSEEDFERTKREAYAHHVTAFQSTEHIAEAVLDATITGCELLSSINVLSEITCADVRQMAREIFQNEHYTLAIAEDK